MFKVILLVLISSSIPINSFKTRERFNHKIHTNECKCIPAEKCGPEGIINPYYSNNIKPRSAKITKNNCGPNEVCCVLEKLQLKLPYTSKGCGFRSFDGIGSEIIDSDKYAKEGEFPWTVLIYKDEDVNVEKDIIPLCGGSLIDNETILTAAHCLDKVERDIKNVYVRAGDWDINSINAEHIPHQNIKVKKIVKHQEFDNDVLIYDYGLIFLEDPFELNHNVETICLPDNNTEINSNDCFVSGWGAISIDNEEPYSHYLKKIPVKLMNLTQCQEKLRPSFGEYYTVHDTLICAGNANADACLGDGGSPLVCSNKSNPKRYVQVGIVAYGSDTCDGSLPGVYANLLQINGWVSKTIRREKKKKNLLR